MQVDRHLSDYVVCRTDEFGIDIRTTVRVQFSLTFGRTCVWDDSEGSPLKIHSICYQGTSTPFPMTELEMEELKDFIAWQDWPLTTQSDPYAAFAQVHQ